MKRDLGDIIYFDLLNEKENNNEEIEKIVKYVLELKEKVRLRFKTIRFQLMRTLLNLFKMIKCNGVHK